MSTHSKGPWHVRKNQTHIYDNAGHLIVDCEWSDAYNEQYANARLIAAAPDLLDIVQYFVNLIDAGGSPGDHTMSKARAAVAKATGKGGIDECCED
jgi:hypothetical protein